MPSPSSPAATGAIPAQGDGAAPTTDTPPTRRSSSSATLTLPSWVIDEAQLQPGDDLFILPIAPGVVQLGKASPWDTLSPEEIEMRIRQVLIDAGIDTRDKTNELVREVRREMAAERPPSQTPRGSSWRQLGKQQPYASGSRST